MSDRYSEMAIPILNDGSNAVMTSHSPRVLSDALAEQIRKIEEAIADPIELDIRVTVKRVISKREQHIRSNRRDAIVEDYEEQRQRGPDSGQSPKEPS